MRPTLLCLIALLAAHAAPAQGGAAPARNLVPDPAFAEADLSRLATETTWRVYQIAAPSSAVVDKDTASVALEGGKTFLHSSAFTVEPGTSYRIQITGRGDGVVSVELLWWTRYDDEGIAMAKPHRTYAIKAKKLTGKEAVLTGTDTAPKDALRAYIRIVAENGTVTVSKPSVQPRQ